MCIVFHDMPQHWPRANGNHRLRDIFGITSKPHSCAATEQYDFHGLTSAIHTLTNLTKFRSRPNRIPKPQRRAPSVPTLCPLGKELLLLLAGGQNPFHGGNHPSSFPYRMNRY